jgi:heptosyltransferase-2
MLGLGLRPAPTELELFIPGDQIDAVKARVAAMADFEVGTLPMIGFNPGAAYGPAKRWPAEKFAQLAQMICRDSRSRIVLFGSEADRATCADIIARSGAAAPRMLNLAGSTSLIEAMALIGECDVFITNDSGLMHVAAALRTPLVAIFGSTDHVATGPYADNAVVIRKPLPCSPCKRPHCPEKHFRCMQLIDSDEVFAAVNTILEQR